MSEDLIGDAPKKKAAATKKAPAATGKKAPVKKAAKAAARGERGTGKYYFPVDSKERNAIKARVQQSVKGSVTTRELAEKLKLPTWKVRLCAQELEGEKKLKTKMTGSMLTVSPR